MVEKKTTYIKNNFPLFKVETLHKNQLYNNNTRSLSFPTVCKVFLNSQYFLSYDYI